MESKKHIPKKKPAPKKKPSRKPIQLKPKTPLSKEEQELQVEEKKRSDWERNNLVISDCFLKLCLKGKKFPTYQQIAKDTDLDERTVRRHFEQSKTLGDQTQKVQVLRDRSLLTIAIKAIKGEGVEWNRLLHQITDGIGGLAGVSAKATSTTTPTVPSGGAGRVETEVTLQIS